MKQFFLFAFLLFFFSATLCAQSADSISIETDSLTAPQADTVKAPESKMPVLAITLRNKILNQSAAPVSFAVEVKKQKDSDFMFYLVTGMVLLLAFFKYFYHRYFTNLFRVFFNTSLRQNQLTDQLLQAKLPSLLFNLFFVLSTGLYGYFLLAHYHLIPGTNSGIFILSSLALTGLVYFIKFCTLKFTGWITGLKDITNTYVFVVFLINKIIGIFLVPFIIILSFSAEKIVHIAVIISLISVGIFLLLRYFRSYGLLQNQLKISRFHFILYILGIELLPLLLIYKGLMDYLSKSL